ncbi:MAG: hypothetical protein B7Y56_14685 [Gallionellales bacterium 35-53-114]|jgi:hypothetical protein|nr:MAG: hypothetical protein B7Y56_14685 [Gallionellales bacterium 35-53-114]OYZ63319.1 MAG: hypothetical protein B7Y04_10630 [Gallionellales bacterium 24-53-125]OZB08782.1 MAG: hypothetical protein B7X61_09720 [Gallionellales bacterium 39-52-133]HQS57339.1 hypothetical protein [Gallionellaceae bacterium]HQS74473.1 hypothetical protein [Gallionellaceae bacterium]
MKKLLPLLCLIAGFSSTASAADISTMQNLAQSEFRLLSEDLGSALSYKPVSPTEPLGITGFDIGLEVTSTDISKSSAALATASGGSSPITTLIIPKIHVAKGLPFGIDVAAFAASIPTTNIRLVGGELRVALLKGGVAYPAIALRGAMTKLSGVEQLALDTKSLDISISKGFLMFTPYAGVGQVWVTSTPQASAATVLTSESITQNKVFVGANLNFGLANFALEGDKTGGASSYSAKFGFRW